MRLLLLAVCLLTAVKFGLLAHWLAEQPYRRAARSAVLAAVLCLVAAAAAATDNMVGGVSAGAAALALGIGGLALTRVGRG